jgi:uncharacterized protein (TIGR02284 family)
MKRRDIIAALNELIAIAKDVEYGLHTCAGYATAYELRQLFEHGSTTSAAHVAELNALVLQYGGRPSLHGTLAGAALRAWVRLRDSVNGLTDEGLIDDCERAEDQALARFRTALSLVEPLPGGARALIARQADAVGQHRELLRQRRHELQAVA